MVNSNRSRCHQSPLVGTSVIRIGTDNKRRWYRASQHPQASVTVRPIRDAATTEGADAHEQVQGNPPRRDDGRDEPVGVGCLAARQLAKRVRSRVDRERALAHDRPGERDGRGGSRRRLLPKGGAWPEPRAPATGHNRARRAKEEEPEAARKAPAGGALRTGRGRGEALMLLPGVSHRRAVRRPRGIKHEGVLRQDEG